MEGGHISALLIWYILHLTLFERGLHKYPCHEKQSLQFYAKSLIHNKLVRVGYSHIFALLCWKNSIGTFE